MAHRFSNQDDPKHIYRRSPSLSMDDLSIVIPVFNEDEAIVNELRTHLTTIGCEVIVVDDGSDVPMRGCIRHEKNEGYGSALMTGIKAATRPISATMS